MPNSEKKKRKGTPRAKINPKQQAFIDAYLVNRDATAAAKKAGYSPKSAGILGHQLLKNPLIAAKVAEKSEKAAKKAEVTCERILEELAAVAFGRITNVISVSGSRVFVKDTKDWCDESRAAVSEIKESITEGGGSLSLKMHNKVKSLELLMRYKGMIDRKAANDPDGNASGEDQETIETRLSKALEGYTGE